MQQRPAPTRRTARRGGYGCGYGYGYGFWFCAISCLKASGLMESMPWKPVEGVESQLLDLPAPGGLAGLHS
ncbi:hypothetical protein [Streptomyces erythrochromogenes]|uniref:hypothetical protein n=1 Tax=Streptomyces erythrochromogenes TaxID=285574 RepID=UPI003824BC90